MKKGIHAFLLIIWVCFQVDAQEQLTDIKGVYGANSIPLYLGTINGKTIFVRAEGNNAIWVTDGTEAGTHFVKAIPTLLNGSVKKTEVSINDGFIYFLTFGKEYANYPQLWRTDGTEEGTSKVLESVTDNADESYRQINLLRSDQFFFITLHYSNQIIAKKYNYNFELLSTESAPLTTVDARASLQFVPTVFNDRLYLKLPSVYVDNGNGYSVLNIENFVIDGNLYRTYATNLLRAYDDNNSPVVMGVVNAFVGNELKPYSLRLNIARKITSFDYRTFNNELYAVITSFEKSGGDTGIVELYQLNKNTGFELKGTYTNLSLNPSVAPIVWQKNKALNIMASYNDCRHTAIDLQTYGRETVKTFPKQGKLTAAAQGIIQMQADANKIETITYISSSGLELPTEQNISWQAEIEADKWFVSANIGRGTEPYTFDLKTGKFTLIKDINPFGINIFSLIPLNKQAVWLSYEEDGVNVYKSDGTKGGTKLLGNISTAIPKLHPATINTWSIAGGDLIYNSIMDWDLAEMYHNFAPIHLATNGIDKALKLYESKDFIEGSSALKIGDNYYYSYCLKENGSFMLHTVKVYPDGRQEPIKTLNLSDLKYPLMDVRNITNMGENYFSVGMAADYSINGIVPLLIDALTGEIINKNIEKHLVTFKNKFYFNGIDQVTKKKSIYVYENGSMAKLIETDGSQDISLLANLVDEELIFWETGNLWITNGTTGDLRKIPDFPMSVTLGVEVKKFRDSYLFQTLSAGQNNKWMIYSNGIFKVPALPAPGPLSGLVFLANKGIIYDDKLYFYINKDVPDNINLTRLMVYAFDGDDVKEMFSMADYSKSGLNNVEEDYLGGFWFLGKALPNLNQQSAIYWKPGHEPVRIAQGPAIVRCDTLLGKKIILKVYTNSDIGDGKTPYQLYISDGISPARLVSPQQFMDYGNAINTFASVDNKFYFSASTDGVNFEPWETDGTPEGTKMAADLLKGEKGSNPDNFMNANGIPVCVAATAGAGRQLFSILTKLAQPVIVIPSTEACEGETIVLMAPKDFDSYKWIINETDEVLSTDNKLSVTKAGNYKVIVSKGGNTSMPSNAVDILFKPLPAKPLISLDNNQLTATTTATALQWYLNGTEIAGATAKTLIYNGMGDYSVKVTENGCSVVSDKLLVAITSLEDEPRAEVYPNPVSHKLIVKGYVNKPSQLRLTDMQGRVVLQQTLREEVNEIEVRNLNKGVYLLTLDKITRKIIIE